MSEKLKPTPGPWVVAPLTPNRVDTRSGAISISWSANHDGGQREREAEENARLISETGTVFHECGLSPRELLEAVRELHEALATIYDQCGGYVPDTYKSAWSQAFAALAKHKEV
ncbi:hypothetical protein [Comamonas sp.]|uniref:hypothetical protein n=1 Tax=Comamonas sp. TaxID=34028 RepID=UPI0028AF783C|nr:hypothetical protein [Comamonas sp.]